jgi:hypothetical protein
VQSDRLDSTKRRLLVASIVPTRVSSNCSLGALEAGKSEWVFASRAANRDDRAHQIRMTHTPLQGLLTSHRVPDDRLAFLDPEFLGDEPVRSLNIVTDGHLWKVGAMLRCRGVTWGRRLTVAKLVGGDDEIDRGIVGLPRADQEVVGCIVISVWRADQHRVAFVGVEGAANGVDQSRAVERLTGLEGKLPRLKF